MKIVFVLIDLLFFSVFVFFSADMVHKTMLPDTSAVPEITDVPTEPVQPEHTEKKNIPRQSIEPIVQRNLFKVETVKKEGSDKASGGKEPEKIEPTTLSLILWGTVTGGSDLYAVIEDKKSGIQALYQEGDLVQEATIKKILKKEIVLTFHGKDQILEMETNPENAGLVKKPLNKSALGSAMTRPQNGLPIQQQPVQPQLPQPNPGNAGEIMAKIKLRPFFTKGSPDGVMVYAIKPDSVFNKAGIRNGDIVKSINGTQVSSVEDASSMLSGMENAATAKLTVVRSGEIKEISYAAGNDGNAVRPSEGPAHVAPEQIKEEKLPDPPQDKPEAKPRAPEDQELEKAEHSEDKN
jgi:general secretion pathway protein C